MPSISEHDALPAGARLGEFEIQKILGVGGFGVVYLALDHALQRQVAIKEYMPASLAVRGLGREVVLRSGAKADTFELGRRSFINEARLLARFDHPALVKVYRFWEEHGTAYMVMPYYQGETLHQVRGGMTAPPDEVWLRRLVVALLGAVECLHRENVFHRDIAPDNILLVEDEAAPGTRRPVLLDLGAARRVIGDQTHDLTAIVKPSFAPIEQYAETSQLRQGPWTDLYALSAVLYFCVTGRPPAPATARAVHDELPPLRELAPRLGASFGRHYSPAFVAAVDQALSVHPHARPASVAAWREALTGSSDGVGDAAQGWMHQTVLLRGEGQEAPTGHLRVLAEGFATTVPVAGRLDAPPSWPNPQQPEEEEDALALREGRVDLPLQAGFASPGERPPMFTGGLLGPRRGLGWAFALMLALTWAVVWWSQRHVRPLPLDTPPPMAGAVAEATLLGAAAPNVMAGGTALSAAAGKADEPLTVASSPNKGDLPKVAAAGGEGALRRTAAEEPRGPANPRRACAGKTFIMLAICMKQRCARPEYSGHAECARMRRQEAAQHGGY